MTVERTGGTTTWNTPSSPVWQLAELIAPTSTRMFFSRYWEREVLHVSRSQPAYFTSLLGLRDLDHLIAQLSENGSVQLARAEGPGAGSSVAPAGPAGLPRLYHRFAEGDTVIVDGVHKVWRPLADLCRSLLVELGMQVQANVYVTPRRSGGFACHWDGHDTLILQVEGKKAWTTYPSEIPLPLPTSTGAAFDETHSVGSEYVLQTGDALYIPRGVPHRAHTLDEASVHVTVGLMATTWADLLMASLEELVESDPRLSEALPVSWATGELHALSRDRYVELIEKIGQADLDAAITRLTTQLVETASPMPDGHFSHLDAVEDIGPGSMLCRRKGNVLRASVRRSQARLSFPGSFISGPTKLFWAFDFIARAEQFLVKDIPGWYSDHERVLIGRALVRAGCLHTLPPQHGVDEPESEDSNG